MSSAQAADTNGFSMLVNNHTGQPLTFQSAAALALLGFEQ
jgi:hypothetical protein